MKRFSCSRCFSSHVAFGAEIPECCGQPAAHAPLESAATTREVVDTGLMARRLEVVADVVDLQRRRNSDATIK